MFKLNDLVVVVARPRTLEGHVGEVCAVKSSVTEHTKPPRTDYYVQFTDGSREWINEWHLEAA